MQYQKKNIIFFGCGHAGQRMLRFFRYFGNEPLYFSDNNSAAWGMTIDGVEVIPPSKIAQYKPETVLVTAGDQKGIVDKLRELGFPATQICSPGILTEDVALNRLTDSLPDKHRSDYSFSQPIIFIDLSCGMVLGGVEQFSYQLARTLKSMGLSGYYLIPAGESQIVKDNTFPSIILNNIEKDGVTLFNSVLSQLQSVSNSVVIANFPFEIFQAACVFKKRNPNRVKVLSIVHNDEEIYFERYSYWSQYIDFCLTISNDIKKRIEDRSFPADKIRRLRWSVDFPPLGSRTYDNSRTIRLGYAGRVTVKQKRVNLLLMLAEKLLEMHVDFRMEIAGEGDFSDELERTIADKCMQQFVQYLGRIDHENIFSFWNRQDIYISCSEWEGHSISQVEAMGMGAVPIVMETSGVSDDIEDGETGFVVSQGDVSAMAEKIYRVYQNIADLQRMSGNASSTIRAKYDTDLNVDFWHSLIE